jgi:endogenous inhibitor of DNA gyrase (YacG/DUF329 family)
MKKCPQCQKPSQEPFGLFCSKRCQNIDLNRWLTGYYAIPTNDPPSDQEEDDVH